MSNTRSERVFIAILNGREIDRVLPASLPLHAALQAVRIFNQLNEGTRQHAAVVYPISDAICSASPRSRSA
jgi:methylaspartate ammonia-lyase